jgi:hypothetical protein
MNAPKQPSPLDNVDVHDAGENLVVTGKSEEFVNYVLAELQKDGASISQKAVKVGSKWVGMVANPALALCSLERIGYELWIRGPSESAIVTRSHEFRERGAIVVKPPHQENGQWAMCLEEIGQRLGIGTQA